MLNVVDKTHSHARTLVHRNPSKMEIKIVELHNLMTISETEFSESNHVSTELICLLKTKQRRNLKSDYAAKAIDFVINQPENREKTPKFT